jgi:hypothetical protein
MSHLRGSLRQPFVLLSLIILLSCCPMYGQAPQPLPATFFGAALLSSRAGSRNPSHSHATRPVTWNQKAP